jgi:uncharacterized protein (TIGR02118 family)
MIKVTVLYANGEGNKFDMGYYLNTHMPMVRKLLGPALKGMAVEQGLGGGAPGSPAPFLAVGHLMFDSVEAFQGAFGRNAQAVGKDVPNYTNIQPVIQVSEVKL